MSTDPSVLSKLRTGLPVDLVTINGPSERRISRFVLVEVGETQVKIKPADDERIRALPRVGNQVGLLVHCGGTALKSRAIVAGLEGSRIDPLMTVVLGVPWTELSKRASERVRADLPVDVHVPDPYQSKQVSIIHGRLIDVSITGCRVRLAKALEKGTMLSLTFSPPGTTRRLTLMGQAIRATRSPEQSSFSDVGIRFAHVGQDERDALQAWVSELLMEEAA